MAGRLVKDNIRLERAAAQGSEQTTAEAAVMLNGERGVRLVGTKPQVRIQSAQAQKDGIALQGSTEFAVLYLTLQGELRSGSAQSVFSTVIPAEGAAPGQRVKAKAMVCGVTAAERDGRLELAARLLLNGMTLEEVQRPAAVDFDSDGEAAKRFAPLNGLHTVQAVRTHEALAEVFPVMQEGMTEVVWQEAVPEIMHVQALDGAAEISGRVRVDCLLAGDSAGDVVRQKAELPFVCELMGDGIRSDMNLSAAAAVRDAKVHLQAAEEEPRKAELKAECVLELSAEGYGENGENLLQDVYPLTEEPFEATYAQIGYLEALKETEQKQSIEAVLELPADAPPIRYVAGAFAVPVLLETDSGEEVQAEGLLRVTLLYRTDGQDGLEFYEQEVPFGVSFDGNGAKNQILRVEIGEVEAQRLSPVQVQIKAEIELEALWAEEAQREIVETISFEGEPVQLDTGITLYYPEEQETLWDVAKRYRVREESLRRYCDGGKVPVMVYRRLTKF